jgi:group I intron endonuclease
MGETYIYILSEPTSNQVRYVGKTKDPNRRLKKHISERFIHDSYKDRWIRKIVENGELPEITVIDTVDDKEWIFWERFYISYFKFIGCNLTNGTDGGDQPPSTKGRKQTIESRLKMSNAKKGKPIPWLNNGMERTESHKKNLSKSCKGRISPNKGNKYTDEFRQKLSKSSTVKRKVNQLSLDGVLIRTWDSIAEAQKTLQIGHISEVCRSVKQHKTSGGFIWKYV